MRGHSTRIEWRGHEVVTLDDILRQDLAALFVGLNPAPTSVQQGHYHQGRLGGQFWALLESHGIVPTPTPGEFQDDLLLDNNLGITDLVKVPTSRADVLDPDDVTHGAELLRNKVREFAPRIVCSVYKRALEEALNVSLRNRWGMIGERFEGSTVFILPFPYRPAAEVDIETQRLRGSLMDGQSA